MASPATAFTRPGQNLATGNTRANFLKVWSKVVLRDFLRRTLTMGKVFVQSLEGGAESATFPVMGGAVAAYHNPLDNIITDGTYLNNIKTTEKRILIDGLMVAPTMLGKIDKLMVHWPVASLMSQRLAWALADAFDLHTLQTIFHGSEDAATITADDSGWGTGGNQQHDADFETSATSAKATLDAIAVVFDQNNVPDENRHFAMRPSLYRLLAQDSALSSRDYNVTAQGDLGTGRVLMYQNWHLHKTNMITRLRSLADFTTGALASEQRGTDYLGKFTNCVGLAWQQETAVGVVKLDDFAVNAEWKIEYQADLIVGGFSCGHGVLSPQACASVLTASD